MPTLAPGAKTFSKRILYMKPPTKTELKKAAQEEEAKNSSAKKKIGTFKFRGRKLF